jgi:hypothetical protein
MWILMWRPAVGLIGLLGATTAIASAVISKNPAGSNTLMGFVVAMMVFQAVVSIVLILVSVWGPIRRWLGFDATRGRAQAP